MDTNAGPLVVGIIFPAKKIERLLNVLREERDGVRFVLIDLYDAAMQAPAPAAAELIARQCGKIDALLHKLAHEMVFSRLGDSEAAHRLEIVDEFLKKNPSVKVIDPLSSVRLLTDRLAACEMLTKLTSGNAEASVAFRVPAFRVVDGAEQFAAFEAAVDAGEMSLPLICKSVEACATERSHMMSVITKREDLQLMEFPVLYQEFINHSGRLFKGYALGECINVAERQSLPNLVAGKAQRVQFDTQRKYPTSTDFHPTSSDESPHPVAAPVSPGPTDDAAPHSREELFAAVRAIGTRLRDELQLSLFGFDVIVADGGARELCVIDVNYFPSYKELDDFDALLRHHIRRQCGRVD